jgi:mandelamide amidase
MPLSRNRFDQVGPLARSVGDVILFDSVSRGEHSPVAPVPLKGVRIGISEYLMLGIDAECGRIVAVAIDSIKAAGVEIVNVELPASLREASDVERALLGYELLEGFSRFLANEGSSVSVDELVSQAGPNLKALLAAARNPGSQEDYDALNRKQIHMKTDAIALFGANRIAALAFAPSLTPAFPQGDPDSLVINGRPVNLFTSIGRQVAIGSCASLSCLVLPAGMTAAGLPVGLEFDALPGADRRLMALGLSLEKALGPIRPPALGS